MSILPRPHSHPSVPQPIVPFLTAFDDTMSGQTKGSFLFIALLPEGQEKSLVYQQLKSKVQNAGTPLGEISNFPIPQFKVDGQRKDADDRLGHWIHWWC